MSRSPRFHTRSLRGRAPLRHLCANGRILNRHEVPRLSPTTRAVGWDQTGQVS